MKSSSEILNEKQAILNFIKNSEDSNLIKKLKEFINNYNSEDLDLPQNQKDEIDRRLRSYFENPEDVLDWKEVKSNLLSR